MEQRGELDALSESDYDFGHFNELDSDVSSEPEVVQDSVDPFTAAQRAQADEDSDELEDEVVDKYAFTQRLLTNAKTLRQLSQQEATISLEYDEGDLVSPPPPQESTFDLHDNVPNKSQDSSFVASQQYIEPSEELFESVTLLEDGTSVKGKYLNFPAETLRSLDYSQFRAVLSSTRRYNISSLNVPSPCIKKIWSGEDISTSPVLRILSYKSDRSVLADQHASPCSVLAVFQHKIELEVNTEVQLIDFIFDHAVAISENAQARSSGVVPAQQEPESRYDLLRAMSNNDMHIDEHGPPNTMATPLLARQPTSVLVVLQSRVLTNDIREELHAASARKSDAVRQFDVDLPNSTAETNYSEDAEVDIDDFPIELPN